MTDSKKEYTFLGFLKLITKWRKLFFSNIVIATAASVIISLQMPNWYKATSIILNFEDQNSGSGLSSILSSLPVSFLGPGGGQNELTYVAIFKSRSMAYDVIEKYNLKDLYKRETMFETLRDFYSDYDVQLTEENMISVSYEYPDSVKVAEIVNYIVKRLGEINTKLKVQRAKETEQYIRKRYFQNLRDIDSLSREMEEFQKKYGVIEFTEQTKAIINATTEIEAQIVIQKAGLNALESKVGKDYPLYKIVQAETKSLEDQLNKLKFSEGDKLKEPFKTLFLPFNKFPELGRKYKELYTNLLLQGKLQEFLLPEYEQAKLQVMKDKPFLQIIDPAVPPDYKSKPKRSFIVIGFVVVAFVLSFLLVLFIEHIKWLKENDTEQYKALIQIKSKWFRPFRK